MKALITGVTGQDGAYLSQLLYCKGYEVYGAQRRGSSPNHWRLKRLKLEDKIKFVPFELGESATRMIDEVQPDEVYNLAAQSFVPVSFEQPVYTGDVNGLGCARLLEAIRQVNPKIRFYQASSSEMFGGLRDRSAARNADGHPVPMLNEHTRFHPRSPYGAAKIYAHHMTVNYREAYGLHASCGICFNHESPLRGLDFVTRKICVSLAQIRRGELDVLRLGNLDAMRDWGFAGDYVKAMWLMLQQNEPDDYVIATGESCGVRSFLEAAADIADLTILWVDSGDDEYGETYSGKQIVKVDPALYRPAEVHLLRGDASKARRVLGWEPSMNVAGLAALMMQAEL